MEEKRKGTRTKSLETSTLNKNCSNTLYDNSNEITNKISLEEVLNLKDDEGLIVNNENNEYETVLNLMLDDEIITNRKAFKEPLFFKDRGIKKALLLFNDDTCVEFMNIGKLAAWRLATYYIFEGTWLSDFIDNYKPEV